MINSEHNLLSKIFVGDVNNIHHVKMDEIFEPIWKNETSPDIQSHLLLHNDFFIIAAAVGIAANAIIIHMIATNKKMRTNHNLILMNYAIADILTLLSVIINTKFTLNLLHVPMDSMKAFCILTDIDSTFYVIAIIFVFALISKSSFQYTLRVNLINMAVFYSVMLAILIISFISCQVNYNFLFLPLVAVLMYLGLVTTVILKENIWRCCCKLDVLSREMVMRMNVARIYTYCSLISGICYFFTEFADLGFWVQLYFKFFHVMGYLTSCWILLYLAYVDKKFQICLLNLFRKEEDKYNIDATIGFSEEEGEPRVDPENVESVTVNADVENNVRVQEENGKNIIVNPQL